MIRLFGTTKKKHWITPISRHGISIGERRKWISSGKEFDVCHIYDKHRWVIEYMEDGILYTDKKYDCDISKLSVPIPKYPKKW